MAAINLSVYLNEYYVGMLTQLLDGRTVFAFDEKYLKDTSRPTLSLSYNNILRDVQAGRDITSPSGKLPPFFSNLLPEGKLRSYLARKANIRETQEFSLLEALSKDLPGAILLRADELPRMLSGPISEEQFLQEPDTGQLRFSLAGVQLKFSGDLVNSKILIPAQGVGGHWIVKLPSPGYPYLNELEYSMIQLASAIGITVPETRLAPLSHVENLPPDLPEALEGDCLLSRRFDRTIDGGRIHMEDFAQVFAVYEKYDQSYNYQAIANVLWLETGIDDVLEFVRRLVHTFAIGNADMHMKNWALIYPGGHQAKLSPAYDLVSTIVYPNILRSLPHKMAGIRDFNRIEANAFKKFAQIANLPERTILKTVNETVDAIKESWTKLRDELPMPESFKRLIEEHMQTVPLLNERPKTVISTSNKAIAPLSHPGSFVQARIQLDKTVSPGKIIYVSEDGNQLDLPAPRRMVPTLINNQLGQLMLAHPEFANQTLMAKVGLDLYSEWRKETFIQIEGRLVAGGLNADQLKQRELRLRATIFPINWRKLEEQYKSKPQAFTLDFLLVNGDLWTCQSNISSMDNVELHPDGRRTANIHLMLESPQKLANFSAKRRGDIS